MIPPFLISLKFEVIRNTTNSWHNMGDLWTYIYKKQHSRGSENMQQIYRRTLMPKNDFKVAKHIFLYLEWKGGFTDPEAYLESSQNLWWSFFAKIVNDFSALNYFCKKASWMFDWVLNTPLRSGNFHTCSEYVKNGAAENPYEDLS